VRGRKFFLHDQQISADNYVEDFPLKEWRALGMTLARRTIK